MEFFISREIERRLKTAKKRFFVCDNISEYIKEGELKQLEEELATSFETVLETLVIDIYDDPNSKDTARRLAKMYLHEIMRGRYYPQPEVTTFPNEGENKYSGLLVVRAEIKSICAHHHQPVKGVAYIGIIPNGRVMGLSKYTRIAQHCAQRGTLQEELCNDIAKEIMKVTECRDVAVHLGAEHGCCTNRGINAHSSLTQTTVLFGQFMTEPGVKEEFFDNIKLQQQSGGVY